MKIVVIEDEIRIREGLGRLIGKLDPSYEVVGEAENGKEGLKLIRETMPDVIFTDIRMPEMDGIEMLSTAYKNGCKAKAIILSAYSEFEYAQQAIHLGVKEYLLKPLVVKDISETLHRVEVEWKQSKKEIVFEDVKQIFTGILTGMIPVDEELKQLLQRRFYIPINSTYHIICCYLGSKYELYQDIATRKLSQLLVQKKELKYLILKADREKMLFVLVYGYQNRKELRRWIQYWLLDNSEKSWKGAIGFISDKPLETLKEGVETLLQYIEWNISLGDEVMISYPEIKELQTIPCIYPLDIENQMRISVCEGEKEKIQKNIKAFCTYFENGSLYHPREIKECYVRFFWAFINIGKETGLLNYEELEQQKILEQIMRAKTSYELYQVGEYLEVRLAQCQEEIIHLTVKRAQNLIHEFYQNGITLEEIASRLGITPEYLGTKFHQEIGMTFCAYMKKVRITKAKELLIGTSLKLYEIAEKVGYSDPKYFSRVFKETTGMLPAEYRKVH